MGHITGASGQKLGGAWPQVGDAQSVVTDTLRPDLTPLPQANVDGLRPLATEVNFRVPGGDSGAVGAGLATSSCQESGGLDFG